MENKNKICSCQKKTMFLGSAEIDYNIDKHLRKREWGLLNSKQIECFLCVADTQNISASAQKLYASQSTISRQISLLEEELDMKLFIRGNNFLQLTPAGEEIYRMLKELGLIFQKRYRAAKMLDEGVEGVLKLGLYSDMRVEILEKYIAEFIEKYPNIHLQFECVPTGQIDSYIREQTHDIVFLHDFDVVESSDYKYRWICDTRQFLVYGAKHPLAQKENLQFSDFKDELIWNVKDRNGKRYQENKASVFQHYGISHWKEVSAPNIGTVLFNVQMGNGCFLLDSCTLTLNDKYFKKLMLDDEISRVKINMAWNKNNTNAAIALFVGMVYECRMRGEGLDMADSVHGEK